MLPCARFIALPSRPLSCSCVPSARPQTAALAPVEDRRKALNAVFHDSWEDNLEHSPEFASIIGDKRWNDKISDRSVKAFNEGLAREQAFMLRLAAIDPTGFTDQEKISRDLLSARRHRG